MTYYKATRPDGFSFYSSPNGKRPRYLPGDVVTVPEDRRQPSLCTRGVIHASEVPHATLLGGSWPCRLFEVEGTPVVGPDRDKKCGFYELRSVREIPAYLALGPNGAQVAAFIALLPTLDDAAWAAAGDAARSAAWAAARDAARDAAWTAAWAAMWAAARDAAWGVAWDAARAAAWAASCDAAGDAAWAAAEALVVRGLITAEQFATLYKPFSTVLPIERVEQEAERIRARGEEQ